MPSVDDFGIFSFSETTFLTEQAYWIDSRSGTSLASHKKLGAGCRCVCLCRIGRRSFIGLRVGIYSACCGSRREMHFLRARPSRISLCLFVFDWNLEISLVAILVHSNQIFLDTHLNPRPLEVNRQTGIVLPSLAHSHRTSLSTCLLLWL